MLSHVGRKLSNFISQTSCFFTRTPLGYQLPPSSRIRRLFALLAAPGILHPQRTKSFRPDIYTSRSTASSSQSHNYRSKVQASRYVSTGDNDVRSDHRTSVPPANPLNHHDRSAGPSLHPNLFTTLRGLRRQRLPSKDQEDIDENV